MREDDRADPIAMAFERLQTGTPIAFHSWLAHNPFWLLPLEQLSDQAVCRTEYKG